MLYQRNDFTYKFE